MIDYELEELESSLREVEKDIVDVRQRLASTKISDFSPYLDDLDRLSQKVEQLADDAGWLVSDLGSNYVHVDDVDEDPPTCEHPDYEDAIGQILGEDIYEFRRRLKEKYTLSEGDILLIDFDRVTQRLKEMSQEVST